MQTIISVQSVDRAVELASSTERSWRDNLLDTGRRSISCRQTLTCCLDPRIASVVAWPDCAVSIILTTVVILRQTEYSTPLG
jgi:hypothetical protein